MTPTAHRFPLFRKESFRLVRWLGQSLLGVCLQLPAHLVAEEIKLWPMVQPMAQL